MNKKNHTAENPPSEVGGKILLLIRHAKSNWDDVSLNDVDRPLNDRGKKDAPVMAKRLRKRKIRIDAFICSPAKRARQTAELFITGLDEKQNEIIFISALYDASVKDFYDVIEQINDKYKNVAIFSHNPGITSFANELIDNDKLANMPTCSVFGVKLHAKNWLDFKKAKKEFLFFDYPKKA